LTDLLFENNEGITMQISLNDTEIREALAEALNKKVEYSIQAEPEECWFEVEAGIITGDKVEDIHSVQFCYRTDK
jgi:hypothetical protein